MEIFDVYFFFFFAKGFFDITKKMPIFDESESWKDVVASTPC